MKYGGGGWWTIFEASYFYELSHICNIYIHKTFDHVLIPFYFLLYSTEIITNSKKNEFLITIKSPPS